MFFKSHKTEAVVTERFLIYFLFAKYLPQYGKLCELLRYDNGHEFS